MRTQSTVAPGYCVVQQAGTLDLQARLLFNNPNSEAARYFMHLNRDMRWVKPGQILIVADPANQNQVYQLNHIIMAKQKVNAALATTDDNVAAFLNKHYQHIAALTSLGEKVVGTAGEAGERYFRQIESILVKIEQTYQNQFRTQGTLIGQQFYTERNALFVQLKPLLKGIGRLSLNIDRYDSIKRALGLSTRSIIHEWSTVGVGTIPGYASYIIRSAKAASFMKAGGWVALGLSFMNTTNDVYHACTTGRESECAKVAVRKYSNFVGGVAGSYVGASAAISGATTACVAVGVPTLGVGSIVCGVVVSTLLTGATTWFGSKLGESLGKKANHLIFSGD
ncbi:hypothetical protein [Pseudescherichia vulneris]|uniref:hypothetical protein n=1 Tax=Pseudescherichia vulneris TaxID=566 RepID=UPI0005A955E9|nr:hypothetical protein [Pseudescherichia vulneris]STQ61297.1 Uncharacterised protein [Pseudescherichia vulneris]